MTTEGIHVDLYNFIIDLQEINKIYSHEIDSKEAAELIKKIGEKIKKKKLISKSISKDWAIQLLMKNNVPKEYWQD